MKLLKKYFISFMLPIIIIIIYLLIFQLFNKDKNILSGNQILVADLKSQYVSLFNYLKNLLHGDGSIFYSFNISLGSNMIGTIAYYLTSPLNILIAFSSTKNIPNFMLLIILIKIGLCSLFMNIYLNHKKDNCFFALIYSCFYALMAYNMSYYFNLMWLDCVYLAPLVLYGIDNILKDNNGILYIITFSLSIICNFYIAYMVMIFSIIYFIYEILINYKVKEKLYSIKTFIICFIISLLISSFILVPTIFNMQNILRIPTNNSMFIKKDIFNNFLVSISKLYMLPQKPNNILSKSTPNVYFGILPLLYSIIYFYSDRSNKEKYITFGVITLFFLGFSVDFFNLIWHGFTYPNGYAYRFSFLFSLFMLIISYKTIVNNSKIMFSKFLFFLLLIIFIGNVQLNIYGNFCFEVLNIILTVFFIVIYYFLMKRLKRVNKYLIFIFVLIELFIQVHNSFYITSKLNYNDNYFNYINNICSLSDNNNYRFDSILLFGGLESLTCNDKRIAGANTINNKNVYKFLYNSGFNVTYSTVVNNDNTPIMYSLLSVKNYINDNKYKNSKEFDYYFSKKYKERLYLIDNYYALPIGYMINKKYKLVFENNEKNNPFEFQNTLLNSMSGLNSNVLLPYDMEKIDDDSYNVFISNDNDIYIYVDYDIPENDIYFGEIIINDDSYIIDFDNTGIFKVKNDYEGTSIDVKVNMVNKNSNIYFYYLDDELFDQHINVLKENILNVKKIKDNHLYGSINSKEDGVLFLSIPYDKGWNIYVDGKKEKYFKVYDTFIGINLPKGKHKLVMKYYSPGFFNGLFLTFIGIFGFFIYKKKLK